jgi:iron complex transport system ATP-binding protein
MSKQKPSIHTHDLSIGYRASRKSDVVIAQNLNLTVKRGEFVALLGPNGAGKSTLLRTLAGMQKPLDGQVLLAGEDAHNIKSSDLAKHLSVVLTDRPNIGLMNGYALVALGRHPYTDWTGRLTEYDEAVIRWAVDAVHAGDIADKPVMELSDGQRQKLMIARALAQESDVIILDEPTAYLDLPRRVETMQLLKHLAHETNRAILLSTHDLDLALRSTDSLWLMAEGQIRTGTPEDLVLSDAFEETFHSEGVSFDKRTGTFALNDDRQTAIYVQGNGIPYVWTCRALERNQFSISDTPTATHIKIKQEGEKVVWYLVIDKQATPSPSIQHLLDQLLQKISTAKVI